jgi:hypothetical protein
MIRLRLTTLAVAAGLGLVCGCCSFCEFPLLERIRARFSPGCCDSGACPAPEGPIMDAPVLNSTAPVGPGIAPVPAPNAQSTLPLAPAPRIVPQPLAQPGPYTP